jgi:hypothetical protein
MTFDVNQFTVVLDKGTSDALMSKKVNKYDEHKEKTNKKKLIFKIGSFRY